MAGAIRYRQGLDERTLQPLTGLPHLIQSLSRIWATRPGTRLMRLDFGADLRAALGEDLTPTIGLQIYSEMVASAARHEPEAAITSLQLVRLTESGVLGIRHGGLYYPHGRFNDYSIAVSFGAIAGGGA